MQGLCNLSYIRERYRNTLAEDSMKIESAHSPVRTGEYSIDLIVKFDKFEHEIPFSACASDTEKHGRDLYLKASLGEYGVVVEG